MIERTVLINSYINESNGHILPGEGNLGLLTLEEGLRTAGFKGEILLLPEQESTLQDLELILGNIPRIGRNASFGISANTFSMTDGVVNKIASSIGLTHPDSHLTLGGQHFKRELWPGFNHLDPVEYALRSDLADKINVGHGQSFINDTMNNGGTREGIYSLKNGQVIGEGVSKFPVIKNLPYSSYVTDSGLLVLSFNMRDGCRNQCDFCSIPTSPYEIPIEIIVQGVKRAAIGYETIVINIDDSNPLQPDSIRYYEEIFERLDKEVPSYIQYTIFLDPGNLRKEGYRKRLFKLFKRYNFFQFFIGRDAIDNTEAEIIGTKYYGKVKTQDELDEEKKGIEIFLEEIRQINRIKSLPTKIDISYVISPWITENQFNGVIIEGKEFKKYSGEDFHVYQMINPLAPFPNTDLRKSTFNQLSRRGKTYDPVFKGGFWKPDLPGVKFFQEIDNSR